MAPPMLPGMASASEAHTIAAGARSSPVDATQKMKKAIAMLAKP